MSQDIEFKETKAEVKEAYKKAKANVREWQKKAHTIEKSMVETRRGFNKWYRHLSHKKRISPEYHSLNILMGRATQFAIYNNLLTEYLIATLEVAEGITMYVVELDHDQDKLGKRLKERKKLELTVPKVIGRELREWALEREHEKKQWQRANR